MITNQFLKHKITDQTGIIDYNFSVKLDNTTGSCRVGFSGDNLFLFNFDNGKIFDPYSRFVGTYYSNGLNNLSGNIDSTGNDFYLNGDLIYSRTTKPSGKISYIILDPQNCFLDFNASIYGTIPPITVTYPSQYYVNSGDILTGIISNSNPAISFSVLSGDISISNSNFILSGLPLNNITGQSKFYLVATDSYLGRNFDVPIKFYTDFGTLNVTVQTSGSGEANETSINISPDEFILSNNENALYNVSIYNQNGVTLDVSLTYISGKTGNIFENSGVSRAIIGNVSGFISGFGQLTGIATGIVSGYSVGAVNSSPIWAIQTIGDNVIGALYRNIRWFSSGWGDARFNGLYKWVSDYIPTWQGGINFIYQNEKGMYFYQNNDDDALVLGTGYKAAFHNSYLNLDYDPVNLPSSWLCSGGIEPGATGVCPVGSLSGQLITGIGYGELSKSQYATGFLDRDIVVGLTGLDSGTIALTNLLGSVSGSGYASGYVSYAGASLLTGILYNTVGTANLSIEAARNLGIIINNPMLILGNIPEATGIITDASFTGQFAFALDTGSYNLTLFTGTIIPTGTFSTIWEKVGTGFAQTNTIRTGNVNLDFVSKNSAGHYIFKKQFSTTGYTEISGFKTIAELCGISGSGILTTSTVSGLITGYVVIETGIFSCPAGWILGIPAIPSSYLANIYLSDEFGFPIDTYWTGIALTGSGNRPLETSENLNNGIPIRTDSSRHTGGSGEFSEPFTPCIYSGVVSGTWLENATGTGYVEALLPIESYWWERMPSIATTGICDGSDKKITSVSLEGGIENCSGNVFIFFDVLEKPTDIGFKINTSNLSGYLRLFSGSGNNLLYEGRYTSPNELSFPLNTGNYLFSYHNSCSGDSLFENILYSKCERWKCVNHICSKDDDGIYLSSGECTAACWRWSCINGYCTQTETGIYDTAGDCAAVCKMIYTGNGKTYLILPSLSSGYAYVKISGMCYKRSETILGTAYNYTGALIKGDFCISGNEAALFTGVNGTLCTPSGTGVISDFLYVPSASTIASLGYSGCYFLSGFTVSSLLDPQFNGYYALATGSSDDLGLCSKYAEYEKKV